MHKLINKRQENLSVCGFILIQYLRVKNSEQIKYTKSIWPEELAFDNQVLDLKLFRSAKDLKLFRSAKDIQKWNVEYWYVEYTGK